MIKIGDNCEIDLPRLIDTRLLIQANSGGGKSWLIRRILEQSHGKVQQIILDLEGEFATLREKYDYLLVGKEGDIPISIKTADLLAKKVLELNASVIIDLYELKHHERILFAKRFLDSLINAPKSLWHPCLVVVDEAHVFCPEKGKSEAMGSVIDLCTRGRKRGFSALLATQRLSKLHKDAAAECNNKLIGRTGLDVDMKRASDELGFTSKVQMMKLRDLDAGEFFAFGPAISKTIQQIKVGNVLTTHPKAGSRQLLTAPPTPEKIRKILSKLNDLPREAEQEIRSMDDMRRKIRELKFELRKKPTVKADDQTIENSHQRGYNQGSQEATKKIKDIVRTMDKFSFDVITDVIYNDNGKRLAKRKAVFVHHIKEVCNGVSEKEKRLLCGAPVYIKKPQMPQKETYMPQKGTYIPQKEKDYDDDQVTSSELKVTGGALRMLKAAAMFHPNEITRARMGALAGLSFRSGSFGTYLATLKRMNLLEGNKNSFKITDEGMQKAGDIEQLPNDPEYLVNMWANIVKGGAGRMLRSLHQNYPNPMTREELGESVSMSSTSGSFGTYLATLKRNGLITVMGQEVKAAEELYE